MEVTMMKSTVVLVLMLLATAYGFPPSPGYIAKGLASAAKGTVTSVKHSIKNTNDTPVTPEIITEESGEDVTSSKEDVDSEKSDEKSTEKGIIDRAKSVLKSGKETIQEGTETVVNASKVGTEAVVNASKVGTETVVNASKVGTEAVVNASKVSAKAVVVASKEVVNATKEVVEAGKELVSPDDVCYGELGCFSMSAPWYTLLRPLPAPYSPQDIATQFYLYTRSAPDRYTVDAQDATQYSLEGSDYDGSRETYFITHGFASNGNSSWLSDMKEAILKNFDANVFLVDWGKGASLLNYFQVAANTRVVGATLAKFGKLLIDEHGADASRFHIIGHSLGAQISSYAAKNITKVARLTALDPAQPAFEGYSKKVRLDVSDAKFVEVIHTSSRPFIPLIGLGMIQAYGHVDFYMNGGWNQPGCILPDKPNITSFLDLASIPVEVISNFISCPHGRSYEFLTASLSTDNCTFWGHRASKITKAATALSGGLLSKKLISAPVNDCDDVTCSPMGFAAIDYPGRGSYSVATSDHGTFCVSEPDVDARMRQFRGMKPSDVKSETKKNNH